MKGITSNQSKKYRHRYTESFKRDSARLMSNRGDQTVVSIVAEYGVAESQLYDWQAKYREVQAMPV